MAGMAKKRTAQSSTRGHKPVHGRGGSKHGDMPDWKKSKALAALLMVVIGICLYMMLLGGTSGSSTSIPDNFPRAYIAVEDAGNYEAILEVRGSKPPEVPVDKDGKKYYDAYVCLNEVCPGRAKTGGKPYIFAILPPPMPALGPDGNPVPGPDGAPGAMPGMQEMYCPLCKQKFDSVKPKDQAQYDPTHIERYQSQEAVEIINKIRDEYMKKNSGK